MWNEIKTNPDRLVFIGCILGWIVLEIVQSMHGLG